VISLSIDARMSRELSPYLVYLVIKDVNVRETDPIQRVDMRELEDQIRDKYKDISRLLSDPIVRAYRDFYWRIGIDPTKQRPSGEALVRRILRGKSIPTINNVVDSGNMASAETLVAIGLYDIDKLAGKELILRYSVPNEIFHPIGGDEYYLNGEPVLADNARPIHIFPHRDCDETKISMDTSSVLIVGCGVPKLPITKVVEAVNTTKNYILKYAGGLVWEDIKKVL